MAKLKLAGDLSNPGQVMRHPHVDAWDSVLTTPYAPGDDADDVPEASPFTHHGTAAVALAGVLPFFATGADEPGVELEVIAKAGLLELRLALVVRKHRDVHFLFRETFVIEERFSLKGIR